MATEFFHWFGFDYLLNTQKRLFWGYLLLSLMIAVFYLRLVRQPLSTVFNLKIWWHPSARLDYAYFLISSVIKLTLIVPLLLSVRDVAFWVLTSMEQLFGYQQKITMDSAWLIISYTLCLFVAGDFTRYWLHRLMHQLPWLWELHKVHHSAEVLTPMTFYRVHPLENLLFGFRYALTAGAVSGLFIYYFGAGLEVADILGVNAVVFVAHVVGDNLRHSPLSLRYPRWLEKLIISPAQHQLHHTLTGSRYNYGGVLAIWDWWFGSLKRSSRQTVFVFGLQDGEAYNSLSRLLFLPFKNLALSLAGNLKTFKQVNDHEKINQH